MRTVRDWMIEQQRALRSDTNPTPGPPVLLESTHATEVLLPKGESVQRTQAWSTKPFRMNEEDAKRHKEARIERMLALQELVSDSSRVLELVPSEQSQSDQICIGRAKRNDVVLADDAISTVHAVVEPTTAAMVLVDRNSSNGTFVNQTRLPPGEPMPLSTGDCLRFGKLVYYYLTGERLLLFLELRIVKSGQR